MGAAIAAGSQKWNGTSALFEIAPTSTRAMPHSAAAPVTGCAMSSASELVPPATTSTTRPTSIARPPNVVTVSACSAAPRLSFLPV